MTSFELGINLNVGSTVDPNFKVLISKIPNTLKKLQGVSELDPFILSKKFHESDTVSDTSIDPNANIGEKSPVSYQSEIFKPQLKYNSYYEIWEALKDRYSISVANDCIKSIFEGALYYHDVVKNGVPYCFAFDTSFLMTEGRPYGWLPSSKPKRSNSFISQVIETTMDLSQHHAGAIGIANILVNLAYYTRNERAEIHSSLKDSYKKITEGTVVRLYEYPTSSETFFNTSVESLKLFSSGLGFTSDVVDVSSISVSSETLLEDFITLADKIYDKHIQNLLQNFVHIMHNTFRIGGDSPFTNISLFDKETFKSVFDVPLYPDLSLVCENYEEVDRVQKIFVEFFHTGSPITGKNYRFPVVTANIKTNSDGKIADKEFFDYIVEKNRKRGAFNIHQGEKIATCCRLTSDLSKLKSEIRIDSFGNGGMSIGSHRVVTINLHRMALIAEYTDAEFFDVIRENLEKIEKILIVHKLHLKSLVDTKFLNFFNLGWQDLNMLFSTIGFTGLMNAFSVRRGKSIEEITESSELLEEYKAFGVAVLELLEDFSNEATMRKHEISMVFNVEEIPAENASPKMAAADNFLYSNYPSYNKVELLSNQMVPLYHNTDLIKRLDVTGSLMNIVSGGAILHVNINEQVTPEAYRELVRIMIEEYKIVHFAINVGTTVCENGHAVPGLYKNECPVCGGDPVDFNLRVVGFNTDWSSWSPERREEFKRRQVYQTVTNILK